MLQPELPFIDPTEPRVLPQDGHACFTVNWLAENGRLNRQATFEADQMEDVYRMVSGQPNVYGSQCFLEQPVRQAAFVLYGTHAFVDLDTYRVPHLAALPYDARVRELRRYCDDTGTPPPSAIIGSGRGNYAKWYFQAPVGRECLGAMVAVNRALQRRLDSLGADPKATDATRILRITGTQHSGAQRVVELLHLEQRDGHVVTYDFDTFARSIAPSATKPPDDNLAQLPVAQIDREARQMRGGRRFSREGWHWAIVEDCYTLARMRWGGVVPVGSRDIFGHVIACQMARIFRPETLYREIVAAVSRILPPHYVARDLAGHCSTLLRRARDAAIGRDWTQVYRYKKATLIDLLAITPAEERHMRALISDVEKQRRHAEAEKARRRAAGAVERADYEARAAERREMVALLRGMGKTWRAIGAELGISTMEAHRLGTERGA